MNVPNEAYMKVANGIYIFLLLWGISFVTKVVLLSIIEGIRVGRDLIKK